MGNGGNTILSWLLLGFVLVSSISSLVAGRGLWFLFALFTFSIGIIPSLAKKKWSATVPWTVVLVAAFPHISQVLGFYPEYTSYLALVGLALMIAIELDRFTEIELTPRFAVVFIILGSMAVSGVWAVAQYFSDVFTGTTFISGRGELMWDMIAATVIGVLGGLGFEFYFQEQEVSSLEDQ